MAWKFLRVLALPHILFTGSIYCILQLFLVPIFLIQWNIVIVLEVTTTQGKIKFVCSRSNLKVYHRLEWRNAIVTFPSMANRNISKMSRYQKNKQIYLGVAKLFYVCTCLNVSLVIFFCWKILRASYGAPWSLITIKILKWLRD